VNSHGHSSSVFRIFEILSKISIGSEVILGRAPVRAMFMVLAGIPDEKLRVNVLDFLAFCLTSDIEIDADREGDMEDIVAEALAIARDGNFAERQSALRFLCAHAASDREPEITTALYPMLGEMLIAKDGQTLRSLLATVRDLMVCDAEFLRLIVTNRECTEALAELATDPEIAEDDVLHDVIESICVIMAKATEGSSE
jgi:hypothetical protein